MKKFLFIASALAIVAGCAKVTTVNTEEPQEIAFKAYSNAATKTPIEDKILPDGYIWITVLAASGLFAVQCACT